MCIKILEHFADGWGEVLTKNVILIRFFGRMAHIKYIEWMNSIFNVLFSKVNCTSVWVFDHRVCFKGIFKCNFRNIRKRKRSHSKCIATFKRLFKLLDFGLVLSCFVMLCFVDDDDCIPPLSLLHLSFTYSKCIRLSKHEN